jgi:activator of HSP90 ATPase
MKMKTIRQSVTFSAQPHDVYELLMDSRKHEEFSGAHARISRMIGGKISTYDGYATGVNLELVPDKRIVQTWRGSDWQNGHYSQATFTLTKVKTGTRLELTQTDVPADHYDSINKGWIEFYWMPMKDLLARKPIGGGK